MKENFFLPVRVPRLDHGPLTAAPPLTGPACLPLSRRMPQDRDEIAIVGGGPAGLAAAEVLGEAGRAVTVYERMPSVARKLLIAGRGGLNITHSEARGDFLARYHPHGYLDAAIAAFPPETLRDWCAELGEPTFVGSSGRVFPRSFKASPLLRGWLARLESLGVRIRTRHRLTALGAALAFETPDGPSRSGPGRPCWRSAGRAGRGSARTGAGCRSSKGSASRSRPCGRPMSASRWRGPMCSGSASPARR